MEKEIRLLNLRLKSDMFVYFYNMKRNDEKKKKKEKKSNIIIF